MKAILTAAVVLLFAVSTAVSVGQTAEKKVVKKTVKTEKNSGGAWLGVAVGDYSSKSADNEKKLSVKEGAVIEEVVGESPADSAGLKEDDIITELNGKAVAGAEDVVSRIGSMKAGEKATVTVMRDDAKKTFTVTLGSKPEMRRRIEMRMPRMHMNTQGMGHPFPPMMMMDRMGGVEGMKLMELRDQLGRYFEAPDGKALLVTEVKKNSNARKAGIEAGDVITKIGTTDIEDMGDLHQALRDAKEGTTVDVEIIRKGAHKTMKLEVSKKENDEMGMMNFRGMLPHPGEFHFDNFDFDPEQMQQMMKDLQPELDRIQKEIHIRIPGNRVHERVESEEEESPEPGTEL